MKKAVLLLIVFFAFLTGYGQDYHFQKGAQLCSMKKSASKNQFSNIRSENSPRHSFDILNYSLEFDFMNNFESPYPQSFDADVIIRFRVDTALNQIKLNAVNSSLDIKAVANAGSSFTHNDDTLAITLNRVYNPGEIVDVYISFSHLDVEDNAFYVNNGFLFTDNEPEGARKWFPCYDRPSDKATVDIIAKVPLGVKLVSNGRLEDSTSFSYATFYHWVSRDPVATYLVVLSAKMDWNLDIVYWDRPSTPGEPMPIRFYYNNDENPYGMMQIIPAMADYFSEHYGEHPFEKDGFASLNEEFVWGGMENQTITSICPGCWYESLICHEFAHQWFGDMISPGTWADLWLNEGFATWSESFWWESSGGYAAYKNDVNQNANYYLGNNPGWAVYVPEWAEETPPQDILFNYAVTYCKSACILHLLRYSLGDEQFFDAIYDYATDTAEFKYKNAATEDFQAKLEESTGEDLDWFFNSWVKQPNHPVYHNEYIIHDNGNGTWEVRFFANQVHTNADFFPIPVELKIYFINGNDTTIRVMNDVNQQMFYFNFDVQPTNVFFDMNNEIVLKQASLVVGIDENNNGAALFNLVQNQPNPVTDQTVFTYSLPERSKVSMALYDLSGKKVMHLVNEVKDKGTHTLATSLPGLQNGIYLCRLEAGKNQATIKLSIISRTD